MWNFSLSAVYNLTFAAPELWTYADDAAFENALLGTIQTINEFELNIVYMTPVGTRESNNRSIIVRFDIPSTWDADQIYNFLSAKSKTENTNIFSAVLPTVAQVDGPFWVPCNGCTLSEPTSSNWHWYIHNMSSSSMSGAVTYASDNQLGASTEVVNAPVIYGGYAGRRFLRSLGFAQ